MDSNVAFDDDATRLQLRYYSGHQLVDKQLLRHGALEHERIVNIAL